MEDCIVIPQIDICQVDFVFQVFAIKDDIFEWQKWDINQPQEHFCFSILFAQNSPIFYQNKKLTKKKKNKP